MKRQRTKFSTYNIHSIVLIFITCVIGTSAEYYFDIEKCETDDRPGNWCAWSAWSECRKVSCTRERVRHCGCPQPRQWGLRDDCESHVPQKDYMESTTLVKHTRYIRKTTDGLTCEIPTFVDNVYYPDCIPRDKVNVNLDHIDKKHIYLCIVDAKFHGCQAANDTIKVAGQIEYDVSACSGWREDIFRKTVPDPSTHLSFSAETDVGRRCTFSGDGVKCTPYNFYSSTTESDYGRLSNLAFNSENCQFACAIHPDCRAIEFVQDFACTLVLGAVVISDELMFGSKVEFKPQECLGEVPISYPYRKYLFILDG